MIVHLTRAYRGLFERSPDERFNNLEELSQHCIQAFWFQRGCCNLIVWDATDVVKF
jgi:hypothetical protein